MNCFHEKKWYIYVLELLGMFFLSFIILVLFILMILCFPQEEYHYEYLDFDNNKGIAKMCSYKFEGYNRGGQGSPVCTLYDGTVKQVKEYKQFYDGKIIPIKDIFKLYKEVK